MSPVPSIVIISLCQLVLLSGGVLAAGVASSRAARALNHGMPPLPFITSMLTEWWALWLLLPLVWVAAIAWVSTHTRFTDRPRACLYMVGIIMIAGFGMCAVVGGLLPMLSVLGWQRGGGGMME